MAIVVLVVVLVACVAAAGVLRAGLRASERARADGVADAAALAGADQLALGADERAACAAAATSAHDGDAVLVACRVGTNSVDVVVAITERAGSGARLDATARAEVDR